ncbi:MAG: DUF4381 domain-containing protein [Pseudomonadota bacterium]
MNSPIPPPPSPDPLADLRPYHLPEAILGWPPAPGWWLLGGFLLVLAVWLTRVWWRRRQRQAPTRQALIELAHLRAGFARDGDEAAFVRGLSRLLRRVALSRFPLHPVAGLSGEAWLDFLDAQGGRGRFSRQGSGRILLEAPYRSHGAGAGAALAALVEDWILQKKIPKKRHWFKGSYWV